MAVDEHQLAAALHRDAQLGKAAIQIGEFYKEALIHRVAAAHRLVDAAAAQGKQPRVHRAVGVVEGVEQIPGVEVAGEHRPVAGQAVFQHGALVHLMAPVRLHIHLLQKQKVRILGGDGLQRAPGVGQHRFPVAGLAPFALHRGAVRHGAGVHEEAVIRPVGAKADVIGEGGVFLPGGQRLQLGGGDFQRFPVRNAVVAALQPAHIARQRRRQHQHKGQQRQPDSFEPFFLLCHHAPRCNC